MKIKSALIFSLAAFVSIPGLAHHSFLAHYDAEKQQTIEGIVTEVWFQNPHSRVYVESTNEDGTTQLWESETYPRNLLVRRGWNYNDLKKGDFVVLKGRRARDGSNRLQMLTLVRPSDGWEGIGFEESSID